MVKEENVTIQSITAASNSTGGGKTVSHVYGLGSDQQVYYWERTQHVWILSAS